MDMDRPGWASLCAMFHTLAQTGFRKAEVALPSGEKWDLSHISLGDLMWRIEGVDYPHLTTALYATLLAKGGYALLRPPPSKSDPLGLHWGACTIYLRFHPHERICAARALAHMELVRAVPLAKRRTSPLFVNFSGEVWRHVPLTDIYKKMLLLADVPPDELFKYSMHSWRIYLACALLAANASNATIQQLLRWRSEEALKIYARINDSAYADEIARAGQAQVSSIRTTTLAEQMRAVGLVDGQYHAAHYDVWMRRASQATVTPALAAELPVHDSDAHMADIHAHHKQLAAMAALEDKDT